MDKYCLTALEAAEQFGMSTDVLTGLIHTNEGLAIRSGQSWRVCPQTLAFILNVDEMKQAA